MTTSTDSLLLWSFVCIPIAHKVLVVFLFMGILQNFLFFLFSKETKRLGSSIERACVYHFGDPNPQTSFNIATYCLQVVAMFWSINDLLVKAYLVAK